MIPRYQRILLYSLTTLILLISAFTIRERQKARERIAASNDAMPYVEPVNAESEPVTLDLANDADGSIISGLRDASLPHEPSLRARALLERLIAEYRLPTSPHPLRSSQASQTIDDVFLLKLPVGNAPTSITAPTGLLAVINLHGTFADTHPPGAEVEALTIDSIIGTLHANLPEITQIRFLVDGQPRETLAGHADLTRTYAAIDTSASYLQPKPPVEMPKDSPQP
jgi:hypothetical protein